MPTYFKADTTPALFTDLKQAVVEYKEVKVQVKNTSKKYKL